MWKVVITNDGKRILCGSGDGSVTVWNLVNGQFVLLQSFMAHPPALYSLTAKSAGILITSGRDATVRFWAYQPLTSSYVSIQNITCNDEVNDVELSYDEKFLVAGLNNGLVLVWKRSTTTGNFDLIQTITYHTGRIIGVRFNAIADKIIVSGNGDGKVSVWSYDPAMTGFVFRSVKAGEVFAVAIDSKNHLISCPYSNPLCTLYSLKLNCTEDPRSNGTSLGDYECACTGAYLWSSTNGECRLNCSNTQFAVSTSSPYYCDCIAGFYWNASFYLCYRNCSAVPSSAGGNINATSCYCGSGYKWNTDSCWLDCALVPDSSGGNANASACQCIKGFVWGAEVCRRDCSIV
jgi:WD40 repeat protein